MRGCYAPGIDSFRFSAEFLYLGRIFMVMRNYRLFRYLIIAAHLIPLLFLPTSSVHAQAITPKFDELTIAIPNCVVQDGNGFIWIGAQEGLLRYDGYDLRRFINIPFDSTSLSMNWVTALAEDTAGNLWVGTFGGGLNYFDQITERFIHFSVRSKDDSTIVSNSLSKIVVNEDGSLWIGTTDWGLFHVEIDTTGKPQCTRYALRSNDLPASDSQKDNWIFDIYKDDANCLWIGTMHNGLFKLNTLSGDVTHFKHDPGNPAGLSHNTVRSICADMHGNIWIGTGFEIASDGGGLNVLDTRTERFIHFRHNPDDPTSLFSDRVFPVMIDSKGILWMGFFDKGIASIPVSELLNNTKPDFSLSDRHWLFRVQSMYEDNLGNLWFAQVGWKLFKYDRQQNPFAWFHRAEGRSNTMSSSGIESMFIDRSQNVWFGHGPAGLDKYDPHTGLYTNYSNGPHDPDFLRTSVITGIQEDASGFLWISTWTNGIYRMDPLKESFQKIVFNYEEPSGPRIDLIRLILMSKTGNLFIGTMERGLFLFDPRRNHIKAIDINPNGAQNVIVGSLFEDREGILWLGTMDNGLYRIQFTDDEAERVQHYVHNPANRNSLSYNNISDVIRPAIGDTNAVWIATTNGLNRLDLQTESFSHFFQKDGIPDNLVLKVLEDNQGNIWIACARGLGMYDIHTGQWKTFGAGDGMPFETFGGSRQNTAKGADGQLFFSGASGTIGFYPEALKYNPIIPPIWLIDFKIFHESVSLDTSIQFKKTITLSHDQNAFSFQFAGLNYSNPESNLYAYKMEGFHEEWIHVGHERSASFTNLDPGEYIFRVKGSNNHGVWNETGTSVALVMLPPWWRTTLAYVMYISMAMLTLVWVWRAQVRRIHLRHELRIQQLEARNLQEIDRMKSRFFANISHEFRTPLTLILGPLSQMIENTADEHHNSMLRMMARNAKRLQRLVNQLLELSKFEAGKMVLHTCKTEIVALVNRIFQSFESQAKLKNIEMVLGAELGEIEVYVDVEKFENVMYNLLSNAIKYTPGGGKVSVNLKRLASKGQLGERIEIVVTDSGPGIPARQRERIFERFYRIEDAGTGMQEGSGIGLALTREQVQLHHGSIEVESEPGRGSTFCVYLPLGKEHLKPEEITEAAGDSEVMSPALTEGSLSQEEISSTKQSEKMPIVLVIEDNPDMRAYIRHCLNMEHRILEAATGRQGIDLAIQEMPDLVISDVMMPGMDGFEVCRVIKSEELTSHIPVILLTARAAQEDRVGGLVMGADDYLVKPFDEKELLVRVRNLIAQRRVLRQRFSKEGILNRDELSPLPADKVFLQKAITIGENHIADPEFGIPDYAREIGYSPSQLQRKFHAITGQTPAHFIRLLRLEKAKVLLEKKTGNVSQVAYDVGFNNLSYFSRCFYEQFGVHPSDITRQN